MSDRFERTEVADGVLITGYSGEGDTGWVELHDLLLDEWLDVYEAMRQKHGLVPGAEVLMPVRLAMSNLTCMHNCECMDDADMMFAVSGHTPGSRHDTMRLVAVCEPCLRTTASPREDGDGPIQ